MRFIEPKVAVRAGLLHAYSAVQVTMVDEACNVEGCATIQILFWVVPYVKNLGVACQHAR